MKEVSLPRRENKRNRTNPFSIHKPKGNGPLEAGGRGNNSYTEVEQRIFDKVVGLDWGRKFASKIINLKRDLFKDDKCFSEEEWGQVTSANFKRAINGGRVSLQINQGNTNMRLEIISEKKRVPEIDGICKEFEKHLSGMEFEKERKRQKDGKYLITVEGRLHHPRLAKPRKDAISSSAHEYSSGTKEDHFAESC